MVDTTLNLTYLQSLPSELLIEVLLSMTPLDIRRLKGIPYFTDFISSNEDYLVNQFFKLGWYAEEDFFFRPESVPSVDEARLMRYFTNLALDCLEEIGKAKMGLLDNGILQKLLLPPSIRAVLGSRITEISGPPPGELTLFSSVNPSLSQTTLAGVTRSGFSSYRRAADVVPGFMANLEEQQMLLERRGLDYLCLLQTLQKHISEAVDQARPYFTRELRSLSERNIRRTFMMRFRQVLVRNAPLFLEYQTDREFVLSHIAEFCDIWHSKVFRNPMHHRWLITKSFGGINENYLRRLRADFAAHFLSRVWSAGRPGRGWYDRDEVISWATEEECWFPYTDEDCKEARRKWGDAALTHCSRARLLGKTEAEVERVTSRPRWIARGLRDALL